MNKPVALALAAAGSLALAIGGPPAQAPAAGALGWAAMAGTFSLLMLRGGGVAVMGVLLALLGVFAGAAGAVSGGWAWALAAPALCVVVGGLGALRSRAGWVVAAGAGPRAGELDAWKQLDRGVDPTDVVGDSDSR